MSQEIKRAISIRQPYVELILTGQKKFEYRSQPTNIRERVFLYASLQDKDDDAAWKKVKNQKGTLPKGLIVGSVEIVDCKKIEEGYAYKLANPKRLRTFLKAKSQPTPRFWIPKF